MMAAVLSGRDSDVWGSIGVASAEFDSLPQLATVAEGGCGAENRQRAGYRCGSKLHWPFNPAPCHKIEPTGVWPTILRVDIIKTCRGGRIEV
jgi:hypothetical protein